MIFGDTIRKIKMEIRAIHIKKRELHSVYGFGSFFRSENANDCDLLLVVRDSSSNLGLLHAELCETFSALGTKLSIDFDLTILTEREHKGSPLREHAKLVELSILSE